MHGSGGADTCGCEMLITSAVAIVFSCSGWDTYSLRVPCSIGRATWALVMQKPAAGPRPVTSQWLALGSTTGPSRKFHRWRTVGRLTDCSTFRDYIPSSQTLDAKGAGSQETNQTGSQI